MALNSLHIFNNLINPILLPAVRSWREKSNVRLKDKAEISDSITLISANTGIHNSIIVKQSLSLKSLISTIVEGEIKYSKQPVYEQDWIFF